MSNQTQLQAIGNFSLEDLKTMKETLAVGTSDAQFNLFIRTSVASGLNPFLNHIYAIVYNGKMSIQISVEGIMFLAKRVEGYEGIDTQLVHENDEFEASIDREGKWVIDKHIIRFPRGKVIACYSIAYRAGFKPFTVFMEVDEVQHHLSGTNAGNWKKYFNDFFKKTCTKRSAKGQFGIEIAEDDAPIESAGGAAIHQYEPQRKDITTEASHSDAPKKQPEPEQPKQDPIEQAREAMKAKFNQLGIVSKDDRANFLRENQVKFKDAANPTIAELQGVLKLLDLKIAEKEAEDEMPLDTE